MKTLCLIFCLLLCARANAQVFPLQVNTSISPPYSPYLSDYTAPASQNFVVQIRANDLTLSGYHCRLRITIEGVGITLRTKSNFSPPPLVLDGGPLPQVLYGQDIAEYFEPGALEFSGLSRAEFAKSARLPEGLYRFSVEVLDYNRGTVVSNAGSATAWIILNDPPIPNAPANLSKLQITDPVNIPFTWTPRHSSSPNAAFSTEYIFRVVELWPENRNPNDAFLALPPLFESTIVDNHFLYGIQEPALIPGKKYAWQVQARDSEGRDLFKNNGRSEVFVFQYGEALAIPANLRMRWAKPTTLAIQWDPIVQKDGETRYRLQYRPRRRTEVHDWYETWTRFTDKTLYNLQLNTEYEMRIRSENDRQESEYSPIRVFKTLREEVDDFVCREDVDPPRLPENTVPVFPLSVNDTIHAGGYSVLVRDVMKVGSKYYGSGFAIVPWFNGAKVRVSFENIAVNDRFWLTTGAIRSVWNPDGKFLHEEQTPVAPGHAPQAGELDITVVAVDTLISIQGAAIASVTSNDSGDIVVATTDGKEQTLPKGQSYSIVDDTGNGYVVDEKGNIAKTTATEAVAAASRGERTYDLHVRFARGAGHFGFDEKQYETLSSYYQQLPDGTYVAWKALSSARADLIEATWDVAASDSKKLSFEAGGVPLEPTDRAGDKVTLSVLGKAGGVEEELLAVVNLSDTLPPRVSGKINLATYNPIHYNLEIIPVNGARIPGGLDAPAISEHLNNVYSQAVVEWNVTLAQNLTVPLGDTFDEGETGVFSNYTGDMKKVLNTFGARRDHTYYLFIIQDPRNQSALGYMPRGRQAGFVFAGPHHGDVQDFLKTIAHELGHGAFNLRHTFSEHNLPSNMTDNLMDYSRGTALYKYQWDRIHQPESAVGLFEDEEESENAITARMSFLREVAPLMEKPEFKDWVEKLRLVYEFLQSCSHEGWATYDGKGITPYCFWRDQSIPPELYYTHADLPFIAGLIDGGYNELEGFYNLPEVLRDISRFPARVTYAYTLAYWECRTDKLLASVEDYEYVVQELARMEVEGGVWNWVKEQFYEYGEQKKDLEKYFDDCKSADELRDAVDDLYELATNWEEVKNLSEGVYRNFEKYWETLGSTGNVGRYEQGALVIPAASLFLPLAAGVASKAEKVKTALKLLRDAAKEDVEKVVGRMVELLTLQANKLRLSVELRKVYDDCIRYGYKAYADENTIVFKNVKSDIVAKLSDNALEIKIPEHHGGWARQSNSIPAKEALEKANSGLPLYRVGTMGVSTGAEAQYWSLENPLNFKDLKTFAKKYGLPEQNLQSGQYFVEIGKLKENVPRLTRESFAVGSNPGGSIEVVVPENGVQLESFHTITF